MNSIFVLCSIATIREVNSKMEHSYLKFISQCLVSTFSGILLANSKPVNLSYQYYEDESMELVKPGKLVPKPRINLAFENGKIITWNGK